MCNIVPFFFFSKILSKKVTFLCIYITLIVSLVFMGFGGKRRKEKCRQKKVGKHRKGKCRKLK
jgi:hypothetical protein